MDGWAPVAAEIEDESEGAAFVVTPPATGVVSAPLVFATPHSGRIYPDSLMAASRLDAATIRRSEDAHVDSLIGAAPAHGATVIAARMARAWMDVNREPWELDASMFEDDLPAYARGRTAKVAAGLGVIARVVGEGEEIYRRKLTFAEAAARVEAVHQPYHAALGDLIAAARRRHGAALLIDWHSMPSAAVGAGCDIVLGDRFGVACAPAAPRLVERALRAMGYSVVRNAPYAGGYTTAHYGRPDRGIHALQIEINRGLYMNERTLALTPGFARLRSDLEALFVALSAADWSTL